MLCLLQVEVSQYLGLSLLIQNSIPSVWQACSLLALGLLPAEAQRMSRRGLRALAHGQAPDGNAYIGPGPCAG